MRVADAVAEHLAALTAERGLAANTVAAYRRDLRQYAEYLGTRDVEELDSVTAELVGDFVGHLRGRSLAPTSVARKVAAVRGFHRFAVVEGLTGDDPTVLVDSPQRAQTLPKALTVTEVVRLLEGPAGDDAVAVRDRCLLEFLYATGCRVAEAVAVDVADVDLESGTVLVTGKGDKQRLVLLGSHARSAIVTYLESRLTLKGDRVDPGRLFLSVRGRPLTRQAVWQTIKKHAVRVGLDPGKVSPHVLRHSAATHMVEGGADLRVVQEMLGHATIGTTQMYTRVSPQHLYEVYVTSHPRGA